MKKFFRISQEQESKLAFYMDVAIFDEVLERFTPCSREEILVQVLLRGGIPKKAVEKVLNIDLKELETTVLMIDSIKTCMACYNLISYMKKMYPNRDFVTEKSEKGRKYRHCLDLYCYYIKRFRNEIPGFRVLSDLGEEFPEIDFDIDSATAHVFYKWDGVIM